MTHTSLDTSKALKEAGVAVDSVFWHEEMDFGERGIEYVVSCDEWDRDTNIFDEKIAPAYLLSDLLPVLQQLSTIRGYGETVCANCGTRGWSKENECSNCDKGGIGMGTYDYRYHFLRCCSLFADTGDMTKVDEYLKTLLVREKI